MPVEPGILAFYAKEKEREGEKGKGCQRAENGIEYNDKALLASYNKKVLFVVCKRLDTVC